MRHVRNSLVVLPEAITFDRKSFLFTIRCKNLKRDFSYDFTDMGRRYPTIVSAFVDAIIAKRESIGHKSRVHIKSSLAQLLVFFDSCRGTSGEIAEVADLTATLFSNYAAWLKQYGAGAYITKRLRYVKLSPLVDWLHRNHPDASPDMEIERNAFPMAHRTIKPRTPYSEAEWVDLLKAVAVEIKEAKERLEIQPPVKWKGVPAPLDGVAPFDESRPTNTQHAIWDSDDYLIWQWENLTQCKRVGDYALRKLPGGSGIAIAATKRAKNGVFGPLCSGKSIVDHFYDWIGAGPNYVPRFVGAPCPIRYTNRYNKPEFLEWYWENTLDSRLLTPVELMANLHYGFLLGCRRLHGSVDAFYKTVGGHYQVTAKDLFPYFLLFAVRTALNPTTIQRLTIDCIRPAPGLLAPDPDDPTHWQIDWEKIRSFSEGSTIPSHVLHELMPVSIILRVLQITAPFRRPDQLGLWITKKGEFDVFTHAVTHAFALKHDLTDAAGRPLRFHISRIRSTVAMREYVRTENMSYIQTLLGHRKMGTTTQYISQMDNPILITRRGIHQDAMFIDLTEGAGKGLALLTANNIKPLAPLEALATPGTEYDGLLSTCRDPRHSPQPGQTCGQICSSSACFTCQNLVITNRDLHKYFCFMQYHDERLIARQMDEDEHYQATHEARYVFETYVLPRFKPETISWARQEALTAPLAEWQA